MDMDNLNQAMAAGAAAANAAAAAAAANPAVAATMNLMGAAAVAFPPGGTVVAATSSSAAPPGVGPSAANHAQPQVRLRWLRLKATIIIVAFWGIQHKWLGKDVDYPRVCIAFSLNSGDVPPVFCSFLRMLNSSLA